MTKKFSFLPALLLGAFLMFAPSCGEDDPCKDLEGQCGEGNCFLGECVCNVGYEKDADGKCTVKIVDAFIGNFTVNETCSKSGTASPYIVGIAAGTGTNELLLSGFYGTTTGFQKAVKATYNGKSITIARQEPDNDKFFVEGSGTINTDSKPYKITMSYKVTDEETSTIVTNQCNNVIFTKQ
jgi:hypothetical protein